MLTVRKEGKLGGHGELMKMKEGKKKKKIIPHAHTHCLSKMNDR